MAKILIFEQAKEFLNKLSKQQKILVGSILGTILLGLLIMIIVTSNQDKMAVLYSDLEEKDASQIIEKLKEKNIEYEISEDGQSILVNEEQKYEVRLDMAKEGLPEDGIVGYELFDQTNLGMSEFVQKLNFRRALEGELSKTIQANSEVSKARVHIVIPEKALFEKDQKNPTASIVLSLKNQKSLGKINVEGIQNLVAGSVEGMSPNDVIVVDTRGKILSVSEDDGNSTAAISAKQHEQTREIEEYYRNKIQSMLDGVLGVGNAEARVTAELNFTQIEQTITKYDESDAVLLSTQVVEDVANNNTTNPNQEVAVEMQKGKKNTIENYEVPKTVKTIIDEVGNIQRLSVAVAVNGRDSVVEVNGNPQIINVALPKAQEEKLKEIVKTALGYDPSRNDNIEVYYYPFITYDKEEIFKDYYQRKWWKTKWWEESDNVKLISLVMAILLTLFIVFKLIKQQFIKERIRIALSLPDKIKLEDDEDVQAHEEVEDEELEEIMIEDDDLMLVPAELPDQLLLEGEKAEEEFEEYEEGEEGFDKGSLAARAKASLSGGDAEEMSENALMKLELKNKVEGFVTDQPVEAVKLIRFFLAQDIEKSILNF